MKILFFLLLVISIHITSCVGFFETNNTAANDEIIQTKQQKAEASVKEQILKSYNSLGAYTTFTFGELYTLKPKEIIELEQLFELKKILPTLEDNYPGKLDSVITANDTAIAVKKRELKEKRIYHTYELNHIFKITSENGIIKLYECQFILFPNFKVKDVQIKLNTELDKKEDELFYYFIMQYPLYEFENILKSNRMNEATYSQFNKALEYETDNKAKLLKTILSICKYIRIHNDFNEVEISKMLTKEWISKNENYNTAYTPVSFSELFPIDRITVNDENDSIKIPLGYKLLHKFECKDLHDSLVQKNMDFRFDLNFVITNIQEINSDDKP